MRNPTSLQRNRTPTSPHSESSNPTGPPTTAGSCTKPPNGPAGPSSTPSRQAKDPPKPRTCYRSRTLQISEPSVKHLKISPNGKKATVHIKGLPVLKFKPDCRLPRNEQPREIKITNSPRGIQVNLTFPLPVGPPIPPHIHSVGMDPGERILMAAVSDDGTILIVPGRDDKPHRRKT